MLNQDYNEEDEKLDKTGHFKQPVFDQTQSRASEGLE